VADLNKRRRQAAAWDDVPRRREPPAEYHESSQLSADSDQLTAYSRQL